MSSARAQTKHTVHALGHHINIYIWKRGSRRACVSQFLQLRKQKRSEARRVECMQPANNKNKARSHARGMMARAQELWRHRTRHTAIRSQQSRSLFVKPLHKTSPITNTTNLFFWCRRVDPHVKVLAAPGSKMSAPRCNKKKRGQRGLPGAFFYQRVGW